MQGSTSGGAEICVGAVLDGKYEIVRELGHGAMGVVFEGRHRTLNKRIAVKTLHNELTGDADLLARFRQEAQSASAIGHPNIVEVYDLGSIGDTSYMVMEFLEGQNLGELLGQRSLLDPGRAVKIVSQTLSALGAAHQQGIVHRDLKPENIFLTKRGEETEFVKLLDFGIAKVLAAKDDVPTDRTSTPMPTQFGMVMGTPQYMSPEQARGLPTVDHRTDIWAAGAVLYEMVCGRTPFQGDNYNQVLAAIVDGYVPNPSELQPSLPKALELVILRAMSYQLEERYENAIAMRHDLHKAMTMPVTQMPSSRMAAATLATTNDGGGIDLGALSGDMSLASLDDEPEAAPAPAATNAFAPPGSAAGSAPSGGASFGPPPEEGELSLDVSIVEPQQRTAPMAARGLSGERSSVRPAGVIHRPAKPASRVGLMFKSLLVLALLAGGAGAAYRYYKLGYVFKAPPPKAVAIQFALSPEDAEIRVNDAPLETRPLMADPLEKYEISASAPGRLTVRVVVENAKKHTLELRLPRAMTLLTREMASVEPVVAPLGGATPEWVDKSFSKLAFYQGCLDVMSEPRRRSHDAYSASTGTNKPSKSHVPNVVIIESTMLSDCSVRIEQAGESEPPMEDLEAKAAAYLAAASELVPLVKTAGIYYTKREFEQDAFGYGKKAHPKLVDTYARSAHAEQAFVEALAAHRAAWEGMELAVVEQTLGRTGLWQLRNVAMRAEAWVRAVVSDAPTKLRQSLRLEFTGALQDAIEYAEAQPQELAPIAGGAEFLRGLAPLRQIASKDKLDATDRSEILTWHNQSIELFNRMVLTR